MVRLEKIKELYNFEPRYTFSQLKRIVPESTELQVQDGRLYKAVKALTEKAYPTEENSYDTRWLDFHLPLKRKGSLILIPLGIILSDKRVFLSFPHAQVEVCKGAGKNEFYVGLIRQILKFSRILKKDPGIAAEAIPYDMRTGRVLGRYVLEDLLPTDKKEEIAELYKEHVKRRKRSQGISLDGYLNTAAICYKAAFRDRTSGLTAEQMYTTWADGRDCGMLKIRGRKSRKDFLRWLDSQSNCGGHPFEIVFSRNGHGIHLIQPSPQKAYFTLRLSNYAYAMPFLEMVTALVRNRIPFEADEFNHVLEYLSGESYFTVNASAKHSILYFPGDRKLLKHIEWDNPAMLKWK